jgi:hypothetical protein
LFGIKQHCGKNDKTLKEESNNSEMKLKKIRQRLLKSQSKEDEVG